MFFSSKNDFLENISTESYLQHFIRLPVVSFFSAIGKALEAASTVI
jgi:hypothetical protein